MDPSSAPTTVPVAVFGRGRLLWRRSIRYVLWLLRRRREWSDFGKFLQQPLIKDLTLGLVREKGVLRRKEPAPLR